MDRCQVPQERATSMKLNCYPLRVDKLNAPEEIEALKKEEWRAHLNDD
jgi:hypothetical protein